MLFVAALAQWHWYTHRATRCDLGQSIGFRLEHGQACGGVELYEEVALRASNVISAIDTAAAYFTDMLECE